MPAKYKTQGSAFSGSTDFHAFPTVNREPGTVNQNCFSNREPGTSHAFPTVNCAVFDRGRGDNVAPPSEPDRRVSRIRLSSQWFTS